MSGNRTGKSHPDNNQRLEKSCVWGILLELETAMTETQQKRLDRQNVEEKSTNPPNKAHAK